LIFIFNYNYYQSDVGCKFYGKETDRILFLSKALFIVFVYHKCIIKLYFLHFMQNLTFLKMTGPTEKKTKKHTNEIDLLFVLKTYT